MKILMVCLGNICRSPLAQGILARLSDDHDLDLEVDSAGTGAYHEGESPDPRSIKEAAKHNIQIQHQKARKISRADLDYFDLILTMDESNYHSVVALASNPDQKEKVKMILDFISPGDHISVPDPYYEGGFDHIYQLLHEACHELVNEITVAT